MSSEKIIITEALNVFSGFDLDLQEVAKLLSKIGEATIVGEKVEFIPDMEKVDVSATYQKGEIEIYRKDDSICCLFLYSPLAQTLLYVDEFDRL